MKVEVKIEPGAAEPRVIILTDRITEEVTKLARSLTEPRPRLLTGFRDSGAVLLEPEELIRIYTAGGKVMACTGEGEFQLRQRLYELEEQLDRERFVRISQSEIIHLRKVRGFDLSYTGTVRVSFVNGESSYVSRRYVSGIKKVLGL